MSANYEDMMRTFATYNGKAAEEKKKKTGTGMMEALQGGELLAGGSLVDTSAKDAGGYTDPMSAAASGAQKGAMIGGPLGGAIGGAVGLIKAIGERNTQYRNNMERLNQAGRQQSADSFNEFSKIMGTLR